VATYTAGQQVRKSVMNSDRIVGQESSVYLDRESATVVFLWLWLNVCAVAAVDIKS